MGFSILDPFGFSFRESAVVFFKCDIGLLELAEFTSFYLAIGANERGGRLLYRLKN